MRKISHTDSPKQVIVAIAILLTSTIKAQIPYTSFLEIQTLRCTHGNFFPGISFTTSKNFSQSFALGVGLEYSGANKHLDNGWILTDLDFLPMYLDERWKFMPAQNHPFYFHLSEGVTVMAYKKFMPGLTSSKQNHHESGFFGYGGLGRYWVLGRKKYLITEFGLKSFKLSTNNLDVNPHGINFRLGLTI